MANIGKTFYNLLTFNHISVLFKCLEGRRNIELAGSEKASTCRVLSKDKSGPLIRYLALACISLHLSAVKDTKAEGKDGRHCIYICLSATLRLNTFRLSSFTPPPHQLFPLLGLSC